MHPFFKRKRIEIFLELFGFYWQGTIVKIGKNFAPNSKNSIFSIKLFLKSGSQKMFVQIVIKPINRVINRFSLKNGEKQGVFAFKC